MTVEDYIALDRSSEETTDFIGGEVPLESAGIPLALDELHADLERVEP